MPAIDNNPKSGKPTKIDLRQVEAFLHAPALPLGTCWYVVQTQPHAERKAAVCLSAGIHKTEPHDGFPVYLPCRGKRHSHARKIEWVAAPLFPRYLFVALDTQTQRWSLIDTTMGVGRLVRNGNKPVPVPPEVIRALQQRQGADGLITVDEPPPRFAPGDRVRVVDGAFTDELGLFEATTDQDRVAILINLLGRETRVLLDEAAIDAA
jgi:transcriptional antiterminator RfaH